jgi:hypothetical protein
MTSPSPTGNRRDLQKGMLNHQRPNVFFALRCLVEDDEPEQRATF